MALTINYLCLTFAYSLFLFLFLCSSSISCLGNQWEDCRSIYACGNFRLAYPFGIRGSGCGDPQFQLHCSDQLSYKFVLLNINGDDYQILEPSLLANNSNHSMTIVNNNMWWENLCNISDNYTQSWWSGSQFFHIVDGYTNVTTWKDCATDWIEKNSTFRGNYSLCGNGNVWYYSSSPKLDLIAAQFCKTHLQLPIKKDLNSQQFNNGPIRQGFEITWHVDPDRYQSCSACLISNGSCGHNISEPLAFLCYCPDGSAYPNTCADPHVLLPGNISKSASLLNYKYISSPPAASPPNDAATALLSPTAASPLNDGYNSSPITSDTAPSYVFSPLESATAPAEFTIHRRISLPGITRWTHHNDEGGKNKSAVVIGLSIGGVALTTIAVALLTFYLKRGKHSLPDHGSSTSQVEKFLKEYAYKMPTRYSQSRLKKITNNYAEKLGEGGYGVVYKGKLPNGALVAVKLLDRHRHSEAQFMNEVATIGLVHHVNLVRLLGYCFETPTSALVYEYMVNGSLEKFIFAGKEKGQILGWEQLHSIALGTARGIAYLHQDCKKRIIHFDIKPHNILLDSDFTPKVADFGLAKLCVKEVDHLSMTAARGTPGYVAPEVCDSNVGPVTDKSDVYSFGMLLLEIVGGRKNFDWKVSRSSQYYFPEWVFKVLDSGELALRLRGEEETKAEDEEKARRLTKVGLWCIQYNYRDRPCMNRVVQMLEGIGDDVSNPPLPINSSTTIENTCENLLLSSTYISG